VTHKTSVHYQQKLGEGGEFVAGLAGRLLFDITPEVDGTT